MSKNYHKGSEESKAKRSKRGLNSPETGFNGMK